MKLPTALHYFNKTEPAKVLSRCAKCRSDDIFEFDGDLFCNPCGWNSIETRVESQISELTTKHRQQAGNAKSRAVTSEKLTAMTQSEVIGEAKVA